MSGLLQQALLRLLQEILLRLLQKGLCLLGREVLEAWSLESLCDGSAGLGSKSRKLATRLLGLAIEKLLGSQTKLLLLLWLLL